MVDEQSRRSVALAEGRRGVSTQLDLFARTVVVELEVARSSAVVVCDRSLVDILAYTDLLPPDSDPSDLAMRRAMDAFAEHYLATYAAIFLTVLDPRGRRRRPAPRAGASPPGRARRPHRAPPRAVRRPGRPPRQPGHRRRRRPRAHPRRPRPLVTRRAHPHDVRVPAPTRRTLLGAGLRLRPAAGLTACEADAPSTDPTPEVSTSSTGATTSSIGSATAKPSGPTIPDFDPTDWESVPGAVPARPGDGAVRRRSCSRHTPPRSTRRSRPSAVEVRASPHDPHRHPRPRRTTRATTRS